MRKKKIVILFTCVGRRVGLIDSFRRACTRLGVAGNRPGVSLSDLTDELQVDELCGTAALNGVPVHVERVGAGPGPADG